MLQSPYSATAADIFDSKRSGSFIQRSTRNLGFFQATCTFLILVVMWVPLTRTYWHSSSLFITSSSRFFSRPRYLQMRHRSQPNILSPSSLRQRRRGWMGEAGVGGKSQSFGRFERWRDGRSGNRWSRICGVPHVPGTAQTWGWCCRNWQLQRLLPSRSEKGPGGDPVQEGHVSEDIIESVPSDVAVSFLQGRVWSTAEKKPHHPWFFSSLQFRCRWRHQQSGAPHQDVQSRALHACPSPGRTGRREVRCAQPSGLRAQQHRRLRLLDGAMQGELEPQVSGSCGVIDLSLGIVMLQCFLLLLWWQEACSCSPRHNLTCMLVVHPRGVHLQNARPQPAVVYASSSSVYGLNTKVPFSEEDRTDRPASLYAATKVSSVSYSSFLSGQWNRLGSQCCQLHVLAAL